VVYYSRAPPPGYNPEKRTYPSPTGTGIYHLRFVMNEQAVINTIQGAMDAFNRTEILVVFDGRTSIKRAYNLFRCASVVIGPHGAGMNNIFFTKLSNKCMDPVHVVEIICGHQSISVQDACPYRRSFAIQTAILPWVQYHNIVFTPNSTQYGTYIPCATLKRLLELIFMKVKSFDSAGFVSRFALGNHPGLT
jgi:hypothetical protein